jgi:hypothetical protein
MGTYPGDGQSERFLEIGQTALHDTGEHLARIGMHPLPGKRHEALLDNSIQGLVRADYHDGSPPEQVIDALAHAVALQVYANGGSQLLIADFGRRVNVFLREVTADSGPPRASHGAGR